MPYSPLSTILVLMAVAFAFAALVKVVRTRQGRAEQQAVERAFRRGGDHPVISGGPAKRRSRPHAINAQKSSPQDAA